MRSPTGYSLVALAVLALLLGTTDAALAGSRATDPAGDGAPDIVAVTTTLTHDDELVLEFEFAEDYVVADAALSVVLPDPEAVVDDDVACNAYVAEYQIALRSPSSGGASLLVRDLTSGFGWAETTALAYTVDGPRVTLRVPLSLIGNPRVLRFAAAVYLLAGGALNPDDFPDLDSGTCYEVSLVRESPAPSAAAGVTSTPGGDDPTLQGALVGLLVAAAAFLVYWRTSHWRPSAPQRAQPQ